MAQGRLKSLREITVAQAILFSASATGEQLVRFIDSGILETQESGGRGKLPMSPAVAEKVDQIHRDGKLIVKAQDDGRKK